MEETGGSGGGMGCLAKLSPTPRTILLNRFVAALMPAAARASRRVGGRSGVRRCFLLQWLREMGDISETTMAGALATDEVTKILNLKVLSKLNALQDFSRQCIETLSQLLSSYLPCFAGGSSSESSLEVDSIDALRPG
ncbi:hypothetical protein F2Q69_00030848 [Brassica cretica]|uniref:Uncharacterized protein n=1 Tax=Brassica cretica TaxID=69181 RepID=A0A8S9S018_BRACR|nr:hypothetical protein F2Q69_00030848 [Brassica cretica]